MQSFKLKQLAIAAAVAAALTTAAHGQSTSTFEPQTGIRSGAAVVNGNKDATGVFEAIRSAEHDKRRATEPKPIDTAELARARATGEIKATEGNMGTAREVIQLQMGASNAKPQMVDAKSQSGSHVSTPQPSARIPDNGRPGGAIVYLPDPKPGGRVQITEAERAKEHARYEANKRRGSIAAGEPAPARGSVARGDADAQTRATVSSRTDSPQPRADIVASDLARSGITASERALGEQTTPRVAERAAPSGNSEGADARRARDILSELR